MAEGEAVFHTRDFVEGIIFLFGLYYVLNMEYPKASRATFAFIQKCVMDIQDQEVIPAKVRSLFSKLEQ